jgi:hypothetical protein
MLPAFVRKPKGPGPFANTKYLRAETDEAARRVVEFVRKHD